MERLDEGGGGGRGPLPADARATPLRILAAE